MLFITPHVQAWRQDVQSLEKQKHVVPKSVEADTLLPICVAQFCYFLVSLASVS